MASEDDHLRLPCKTATLKKIKHYQKMLVNNMAYSRFSLKHIQQKTDLLTIAVIRKSRRWTANMAVAWIVSSGEHFPPPPPPPSEKPILGHFIRHFVPQISSQSLKPGHIDRMKAAFGNGRVHDRFVCRHQHLGSMHAN